jgi:hypothetical protein
MDRELQHTTDQLAADMPGATFVIQRFSELVDSVPALRNYHRGMMDRLGDATAEAIAGSLGRAAADPETQIAATSLVGLFRIQLRAIRRLAECVARQRSSTTGCAPDDQFGRRSDTPFSWPAVGAPGGAGSAKPTVRSG